MLVPEYRGYSLLKHQKPDMDHIILDMRYFLKEMSIKGIIKKHKTILFGRSLGSYIATYFATKLEYHSCIVFCGFKSVESIVASKTTSFVGKLIKQKCDNSEHLKNTKIPVLLIHGMQDKLIPYTDIVDMHKQLHGGLVSLVVNEHLEHNAYNEYDDLLLPISDFYKHVLPSQKVVDPSSLLKSSMLAYSSVHDSS